MRIPGIGPVLCACALLLAMPASVLAQSEEEAVAADEVAVDAGAPLTEEELEVVVARIALYPDELVALVIAASLYPLQIVEGARYLDKLESDPDLEPNADWDGSVISLLNYPDILRMMNDDLDWTQLLGELAVNQQKDLLVAIQQLRDEAVASGVLETNEQTVVVEEEENIIIQPADPEVVYVPTYAPEMLYDPTYVVPPTPIVYSNPYPSYYYPSARFWTGVATGVAFAAIVDWNSWGTWGGNVDVNVKVDGNKIKIEGGDKINIKGGDRDIDFKGGDRNINMKNVDRSKISIDDTKINRNEVKNNLKSNEVNRVSNKVDKRTNERKSISQVNKGNDVRKSVQAGLKDGAAGKPAIKKPPAVADRPKAKPAVADRPKAKPAVKRPEAKPATAKRPSTGDMKKKVAAPKPAARPDTRPKKPAVVGNPSKGKPANIASNRGKRSRGGGVRGGSPRKGGVKRGGGRRR
ncbi:MAG: DUF3300 domain-containing protein [Hyphomicrobiales bacterium]|nr:DUF3300 domain-containing protein [Hyphomicrobiales bacterium]